MAKRPIVHDARSLATRDLFHVKEWPLFYQNQCKTQNSFFFHFFHILTFSGRVGGQIWGEFWAPTAGWGSIYWCNYTEWVVTGKHRINPENSIFQRKKSAWYDQINPSHCIIRFQTYWFTGPLAPLLGRHTYAFVDSLVHNSILNNFYLKLLLM